MKIYIFNIVTTLLLLQLLSLQVRYVNAIVGGINFFSNIETFSDICCGNKISTTSSLIGSCTDLQDEDFGDLRVTSCGEDKTVKYTQYADSRGACALEETVAKVVVEGSCIPLGNGFGSMKITCSATPPPAYRADRNRIERVTSRAKKKDETETEIIILNSSLASTHQQQKQTPSPTFFPPVDIKAHVLQAIAAQSAHNALVTQPPAPPMFTTGEKNGIVVILALIGIGIFFVVTREKETSVAARDGKKAHQAPSFGRLLGGFIIVLVLTLCVILITLAEMDLGEKSASPDASTLNTLRKFYAIEKAVKDQQKAIEQQQQQQQQIQSVPQHHVSHIITHRFAALASPHAGILLVRSFQECEAAIRVAQLKTLDPFTHWVVVSMMNFDAKKHENEQCKNLFNEVFGSDRKNIKLQDCHPFDTFIEKDAGDENKNVAPQTLGVSTCSNFGINVAIKSFTNTKVHLEWVFLITSFPTLGLKLKSLRNLVDQIGPIKQQLCEQDRDQLGLDTNDVPLILQTSDFSNAAFLIHYSRLAQVLSNNNNNKQPDVIINNNDHPLFDENMISFYGDQFCTECTDLIWRISVAPGLGRRKTIAEEITTFSPTFVPDHFYYQSNLDYLMQKWGHVFHFEMVLPRPPSGWKIPFIGGGGVIPEATTVAALALKDDGAQRVLNQLLWKWQIDQERIECFIHTSANQNSWCWFNFPKLYPSFTTMIPANRERPSKLRPSHWFNRYIAAEKIISPSELPPILPETKDFEKAPEWVKTVKKNLELAKTAPREEILPVLISLLYTDCDFNRDMLNSMKSIPIGRLVLAWNGHDSCAETAVSWMRAHLPPESFAVVFYPINRGYGGGVNAGFLLALTEAARRDETPPKWCIATNSDVKYGESLKIFIKVMNKDLLENPNSDTAFGFTNGASFPTVAISFKTVERAGILDENFYPAYNEDIDYMWRAHLAGMKNKLVPAYSYEHRNGGTFHGKNKTLVNMYTSRFARGDSVGFCFTKWGNCLGGNVWAMLPVSGFVTPFKAIGVPFTYWTLDFKRLNCVDLKRGAGPTYIDSPACFFDGSVILEDFPDAILPRHIIAPPRKKSQYETNNGTVVVYDYQNTQNQEESFSKLLSNLKPSAFSLLGFINVYDADTYTNWKLQMERLTKVGHIFGAKYLVGVQDIADDKATTNLPRDPARTKFVRKYGNRASLDHLKAAGIAKSFNMALQELKHLNIQHEAGWVLFNAESRVTLDPQTIQKMFLEAKRLDVEGRHDSFIVGDDYNLAVFLVHSSVLSKIGTFDENFASEVEGDSAHMFCGECADFWWRMQLSNIERVVVFHARVVPFVRRYIPTPPYWFRNFDERCSTTTPPIFAFSNGYDYLVQKWGHVFQHQLILALPPSGYTRPFNNSEIALANWKFVPPTAITATNCWIKVADLYNISLNKKKETDTFQSLISQELFGGKSATPSSTSTLRPSQFMLRYLSEEKSIGYKLSTDSSASFSSPQQQPEWITNVVHRLEEGRNASIDPRTIVPEAVVMFFTECNLLREHYLRTVSAPLRRLHIVWTGDDEFCAAETVAALRKAIPDEKQLRIVQLRRSRGTAGAYNAGWRSAVSSAALFDEPIPKWVLFSHADFPFDSSFNTFVRDFVNADFASHSQQDNDAGLFMSGFSSLACAGMTLNILDRAGTFDENFYPNGHQDADYAWRAHFAGLENRHYGLWKFAHTGSGATRGVSSRLMNHYANEKHAGDTIKYCTAKWGDCRHLWDVHYPVSNWVNPFNASGVPFSFWALDEDKKRCVYGAGPQRSYIRAPFSNTQHHNASSFVSSIMGHPVDYHPQQPNNKILLRGRYIGRHPTVSYSQDSGTITTALDVNAYYNASQVCSYNGEAIFRRPYFPGAVLPIHVFDPLHPLGSAPRNTPDIDLGTNAKAQFDLKNAHLKTKVKNAGHLPVNSDPDGWSAETISSLFYSSKNKQSSKRAKVYLVSHLPSDWESCSQIKVLPHVAEELHRQNVSLKFEKILISSSATPLQNAEIVRLFGVRTRQANSYYSSANQAHQSGVNKLNDKLRRFDPAFNSNNQNPHLEPIIKRLPPGVVDPTKPYILENEESIAKVMNLAFKNFHKKGDNSWFIFVGQWSEVIPSSLASLVQYIDKISSAAQHHHQHGENGNATAFSSSSSVVPPPPLDPLDRNIGMIIGDDFDFGTVFAVSSQMLETVGTFDENMNSLGGQTGPFCLECVDLAWRGPLHPTTPLRRKVLPLRIVRYRKAFIPNPIWYEDNADYFAQKWGHAWQHEYYLPRPPSGWKVPFVGKDTTAYSSDINLRLLTTWKHDEKRRVCAEETSAEQERFCWFDVSVAFAIEKKCHEGNLQKTLIRPSWWFMRYAADVNNGTVVSDIHSNVLQHKSSKGDSDLPDWLVSIRRALAAGRAIHYDSTDPSSFNVLPLMVSLVYTDCGLQRKLLGSITTPLKRLVIAWNGDDSCAHETVSWLKMYVPSESFAVVNFRPNRGFSAAFNGGWRLGVAEAAAHNEEPPKFAIVTNADIKYKDNLAHFTAFANKELSEPDSSACFFFGPGVSFCTVGVSLTTAQRAGFLDENISPAYNEDIDYMWRAHILGLRNQHDMNYIFDHVNGGSSVTNNTKLRSNYYERRRRGDTKEICTAKWSNCDGLNVWLDTPLSGWVHPYNSSGLPVSYWKDDPLKVRCINGEFDQTKSRTTFKDRYYINTTSCFYNASVMLEDFPDFVPNWHMDWRLGNRAKVMAIWKRDLNHGT